MKKAMTQDQRDANRRNAGKSTGPRTAAGKTIAKRNALKHGLLAREAVVCSGDGAENIADFDALLDQLIAEFKPNGPLEQLLVERITACFWRLRRAQRFEVGSIRGSLDCCKRSSGASFKSARLREAEEQLAHCEQFLQYETNAAKWLEKRSVLDDLEAVGNLGRAWDLVDTEHDQTLMINERLADWHERFRAGLLEVGLVGDKLRETLTEAQRCVISSLEQEIERLSSIVEEENRYEQLGQEREGLACSIPRHDDLNLLLRYETMIDRELDRALVTLERRQRARRGEVVPAPLTLDLNLTDTRDAV